MDQTRLSQIEKVGHGDLYNILTPPSTIPAGSEPESELQEMPPFKWVGGETKAEDLLQLRLHTEEAVSLKNLG